MLRKVFFITFPRSGHHLLVRCLAKYFSENPESEFNTPGSSELTKMTGTFKAGNFTYCENYSHCQQFGCSSPEVLFQKSHDFQLTDPVSRRLKYIVQYRENYGAAIKSWYEIEAKPNGYLEQYNNKQIAFYQRFLKKWVEPDPEPNRLLIEFKYFTHYPDIVLRQAISFCEPGAVVNEQLLARVIEHTRVIKKD